MIVISAQAFPPQSGGIENLMAGLAKHCVVAGYDVVVLADGAADGDDAKRPYRVERFSGPRPLRRWRKARRLRKIVAGGDVDAVYTCSWKSAEPIGRKLPCPLIAYGHGNEFKPKKAKRIGKALQFTDTLICVSNETLDRALNMTPNSTEVTILHPPVYPHVPATQADLDWADDIFRFTPNRLLSISRLIGWKGQDQAIRAISTLRLEFTDIRLVIAGTGDDEKRLRTLVRNLGIEKNVEFVGRVEGSRKTALLEAASLFVQPGRQIGQEREGFGITYLEAALAGLPTVSGNKGGAPEAIVNGKTGIVVDGEKIDEIIAAFRTLLTDEKTVEAYSAAAREHGQAALWTRMIGKILAVAGLEDRRHLNVNEGGTDPQNPKGASNGQA